ncbi:MAG: prepilin-type N-terminal cleavage/methylation domain-containing protein [Actinobacteria bacterium]|nr:prepilin-type N-terminal cleavage/methylation domain-containing protein [Actinomycetota bacterium]
MQMFRRKDEGFTLVELMVVILIIGILVAIAIPVFNAARATAQERTCHANQRTIEGAAQTWVASEVGRNIADLDGAIASGAGELVPAFIAEIPECPTNGVAYDLTNGTTTCPDAVAAHGRFQ